MRIAATGHRPDKLGGAYNIMHPVNITMGRRMREVILVLSGYDFEKENFQNDDVFTIISGMALGVDTIWALVALKLKRQYPWKFRLECAIPCVGQEERWREEDKKRYKQILNQADEVVYVTETAYTPNCMQLRNQYMVDTCDYLYGVWDGSSGGTKNCLDYAKSKNVLMYVDDPTPWIEEYLAQQKEQSV